MRVVNRRSGAVFLQPGEWNGVQVYNLRARFGITQEELATYLGLRRATVAYWEIGRRKPATASCRLLDQLDEHPEQCIEPST